jgi:hypothetical protein
VPLLQFPLAKKRQNIFILPVFSAGIYGLDGFKGPFSVLAIGFSGAVLGACVAINNFVVSNTR